MDYIPFEIDTYRDKLMTLGNAEADDLGYVLEVMENSVTEAAAKPALTCEEEEKKEMKEIMDALENSQTIDNNRSVNEFMKTDASVRICVGSSRKMWFVNEALLCARIPYFNALFRSKCKEGLSKEVNQPEEDPEAFGNLVDWVHQGHLQCKSCATSTPEPFGADHELVWCKLWVMADKLSCPALVKVALDQLKLCLGVRRVRLQSQTAIAPETVKYVYENTSDCYAPLRQVILNEILRYWFSKITAPERNAKIAELAAAGGNNAMMVELCEAIQKHISGKDCWQKKFCVFHDGKCMVGCGYTLKMSKKERKAKKLAAKRDSERLERLLLVP